MRLGARRTFLWIPGHGDGDSGVIVMMIPGIVIIIPG
jgi:hypothetical protein